MNISNTVCGIMVYIYFSTSASHFWAWISLILGTLLILFRTIGVVWCAQDIIAGKEWKEE